VTLDDAIAALYVREIKCGVGWPMCISILAPCEAGHLIQHYGLLGRNFQEGTRARNEVRAPTVPSRSG
jgi:hypothetical protein